MTSTRFPEPISGPRRWNRPFGKIVAMGAISSGLSAIVGLFLYVAPASDAPKHADVLFVLGPPDGRMKYAEQLMDQGYAGTIVVSVPLNKDGNPSFDLCHERRASRIVCFSPDPFTTQGEARVLESLSQENGWNSADVLTAQFHISRARVMVQRCYKGDLSMVAYGHTLPLLSLTNPAGSWADPPTLVPSSGWAACLIKIWKHHKVPHCQLRVSRRAICGDAKQTKPRPGRAWRDPSTKEPSAIRAIRIRASTM